MMSSSFRKPLMDRVHMDEQEVYAEVDAYVERRQNAKRETSEEADGQESKRMRCSLDTVLLVDEPLQQITGKAECTSKEVCPILNSNDTKFEHGNDL